MTLFCQTTNTSASPLEHRIWSNLHLCFWVTVTHWLQNKLSHIPFKMRPMVFMSSDMVTCEVPNMAHFFSRGMAWLEARHLPGSTEPWLSGDVSSAAWLVSSVLGSRPPLVLWTAYLSVLSWLTDHCFVRYLFLSAFKVFVLRYLLWVLVWKPFGLTFGLGCLHLELKIHFRFSCLPCFPCIPFAFGTPRAFWFVFGLSFPCPWKVLIC